MWIVRNEACNRHSYAKRCVALKQWLETQEA